MPRQFQQRAFAVPIFSEGFGENVGCQNGCQKNEPQTIFTKNRHNTKTYSKIFSKLFFFCQKCFNHKISEVAPQKSLVRVQNNLVLGPLCYATSICYPDLGTCCRPYHARVFKSYRSSKPHAGCNIHPPNLLQQKGTFMAPIN